MKLTATRVDDVPIVELSSLALVEGEQPNLLAIGDKHARLARAVVTGDTLDWTVVELGRHGGGGAQFEGIAAAGDGTVHVLREDPPVVTMLDADGELAERITLAAGDRGTARDIFERSSSAGEGLLPLREGLDTRSPHANLCWYQP